MAWAYVQSAENGNESATSVDGGTATTIAVAFSGNVTAGNHLLCAVTYNGSTAPTSVQDAIGNTLALIRSEYNATDNQSVAAYYKENCAGGASTVTATWAGATGWRGIAVAEYSGGATSSSLDKDLDATVASATGANSITSGNVTPVENNELFFAWCCNSAGGGGASTAGTSFTQRQILSFTGGTDTAMAIEDRVQATAGAAAGTFTPASGGARWLVGVGTFKQAGGGGTTPTDSDSTTVTDAITGTALVAAAEN